MDNLPVVPASQVTPPVSEIRMAWDYIINMFLNGFCLGLVLIVVSTVDVNGHFKKFLVELLTIMHPAVVFLGYIGACAYMLIRSSSSFFSRICKSWFDLIQQFFTLGLGAFLPVKLSIWWSDFRANREPSIIWNEEPSSFFAIAIGAILMGSLWATKDEILKYPKISNKVLGLSIICGSVLIFWSLLSTDGGYAFLNEIFNYVVQRFLTL